MSEVVLRPALYVVATPIGNLGDITLRALQVLREVDVIAAEDTRVARQLTAHFQIDKPVLALHRHNEKQAGARVVSELRAGMAVALTTDAGTPTLSDPGALLVAQARASGFEVHAVPGASALTAAWSVSGMAGPQFLFCGFLPASAGHRRRALEALRKAPYALIFYEAPHRVLQSVHDMCEILGAQRELIVARELTKMFESVHTTTLGEAHAWLAADPNRQRGEFVLIVAGASERGEVERGAAETTLQVLLAELPPAQAARIAARLTGLPKAELYELSLQLKARTQSSREPDLG